MSVRTEPFTVNIEGLNAPEGLGQISVLVPRPVIGSGDVSVVVTAAGGEANVVHIPIK